MIAQLADRIFTSLRYRQEMILQPRRAGFNLSWGLSLAAAGLVPIVFTVVASIGIIQANEIAPDSALADASTLWMVTVLVGAFLVVPALVLLIFGVALSLRTPVASTVLVLTSLATITGVYVVMMVGGAIVGLGDPPPPSEVALGENILPRLSATGVALFVTPFALMATVNTLAIRATWSRRATRNEHAATSSTARF